MRAFFHGIAVLIVLLCSIAKGQLGPGGGPGTRFSQAMAQPIVQTNGDFTVMPQGLPGSRKSGLMLYVDTHWANGYGYRPIEVTVQSPQPATADHLVTIRLHTGYQSDMSVEQDIDLKAGSTKATAIVDVPIYEQLNYSFWWDVSVDGRKDFDLSIEKEDAAARRPSWSSNTTGVRILVAGPDANHQSLVSTNSNDFEVMSLKLGTFPSRWIEYTCFDVVSLSTSQLQTLAQTKPAAFEAIGRWVRTGGQLWIGEVGDKLEQLPAVSKLLGVPDKLTTPQTETRPDETEEGTTPDKSKAVEEVRPAQVGWRPAHFHGGLPQGAVQVFTDLRTGKNRWVRDPRVISALSRDPNFAKTNQQVDSLNEYSERGWPPDSDQWFVEQSLGLGYLRLFRGENAAAVFAQSAPASANPNVNTSMSQFSRALAMGVWTTPPWERRHGMVPDGGNVEFAKLLVPGVGTAPVTEFEVLITLFVLLIGPVNYWLLKRFKRLQLLVLTVPLAAGVATMALFAYAIVSDGFATTVRVRSYTTLDQGTGEAACWARLSYYAGMAPGKGLKMPTDVVAYPILPSWSNENSWVPDRAVVWDADQAKLARGWLTSRTPTQYLTLRARKTPYRLDVLARGGKIQVVNRLGTQIHSLLLIDDAGKFFAGDELANESRVPLQAISRDEAVKRIIELVRDNEPEAPAALAGGEHDFSNMRGRPSRRMYRRYQPPSGGEQLGDNLANLAISDLAGMNGRPALDLPPRSYVAVTAHGPEVEIGIPNAAEEASFHVIVGRW